MTQPHRKTVQHFEGNGYLHELTFSCFERKSLLTNDVWRGILAEELGSACVDEGFDLIAFVFMPEHVHLLVAPQAQSEPIAGQGKAAYIKTDQGTARPGRFIIG